MHGYQAGCDIYLAKPFQTIELIAIVKNLLERSQVIQSELVFPQDYPVNDDNLDIKLTPREIEVLHLLMDGFSNNKIAENLYLSPKTVEKYVANLLKKTGAENRTELVSFAFKHHLL
ncbi:MAG: response regulator transcription factor [Cyanobacterium sp. T60_A2020_053]|nr:response regulator transcription factor [Cyanobacterium sp. T60_A2020_053]